MIYSENILICIALPLVATMPFTRGKSRSSFIALLLGMIMCLFSAYLNGMFANIFEYDSVNTAKYISPIVEEIMKMFPVMMYVILTQRKTKDVVGFAILVGAGFATFENCCYLIENGAKLISFILIRGLSVGVMHVLCGLVCGIGLELAMRYKTVMLPGTIGAFSFAMTIHALYNLLVSDEGALMYVGFAFPIIIITLVYFTIENTLNLNN